MHRFILGAMVIAVMAPAPASAQNKMPDLVVTSKFSFSVINRSVWPMGSDQAVQVTGTVRNNGDATAYGIPVNVFVNGELVGSSYIASLPSAEVSDFTVTFKPTATGRYEIKATVDPANTIAEASEANNTMIVYLNVDAQRVTPPNDEARVVLSSLMSQPPPRMQSGNVDLEFDRDPFLTGPDPTVGREGSIINLDVTNHGSDAACNVEVGIMVDGKRQMIRNIGTIEAGASRHVHLNWKPKYSGAQTISIVLDPRDRISESDESNNIASLDVSVMSSRNKHSAGY